jgi:RNA polymerase sigma-70 factor (ECF subfamily)
MEIMIREEDATILRQNVDLLSPKLKAVVILHYQEEFSLREIAAALEIAEGTVKSRLSLALTILRSKIKKGDMKS